MCSRTTCRKCGKASWSGCGQHIEEVLNEIPKAQRCQGHENDPKQPGFFSKLLVAAQFTLLITLFLLSVLSPHKRVHTYLIFEIVLVSLGGVLLIVASHNLRPSLKISPIPKQNAPLISVGVYKYVRHPMYLAVILIGFSLAGYAESIVGWIFEVLLIATLNVKATLEDALILELHPEALHFQMHTSKLIPFMGNTCRSNCNFTSENI